MKDKLNSILLKLQPKKRPEKKSVFTIEYYPMMRRHYPKCDGLFLSKNHNGIIEKQAAHLMSVSDNFETEGEAQHLINLYKEQWEKVGVIIKQL